MEKSAENAKAERQNENLISRRKIRKRKDSMERGAGRGEIWKRKKKDRSGN